ncbi:MAG: S8 family serine peptidase [Methylococcaceae bacterium]|nr:S8 family serine peptidase [Methylococcaceae bacterium]
MSNNNRFSLSLSALLFSSLCLPLSVHAAGLVEAQLSAAVQHGARFKSGQLVVQYRVGADTAVRLQQAKFAPLKSAQVKFLKRQKFRQDGKGDLVLAKLTDGANSVGAMAAAIEQIKQDPAVEYAEPNWVLHHLPVTQPMPVPDDEFYLSGDLWGMYGDMTDPANPYGSQAAEVWRTGKHPTDCSDIYVGLIDEGIMTDHPDLSASIWQNTFDPEDGIDNDGNGFIDDVNGWDFYNNDNSINDGPFVSFHGTHIAGVISAEGNNGIGVAGVCWKAKLISAKFMDFDGGDTVNAIKAIDYITDLKLRHKLNIVATNNSWGGGGFSQAMIDAIKRAEKADILFVAAAGNDGTDNDVEPLYPASYTNNNIISVASLDQFGQRSSFSNFGKKSVDIAAPGEEIMSTIPPLFDFGFIYGIDSGTSMAAPFVTGAVAIYAHYHPHSKAQKIKKAILRSAEPTPDFESNTVSGGRLNIPNALRKRHY